MVNGRQKTVTHRASATFIAKGLQTWAIGTFDGGNTNGIATLTVSNAGKLNVKRNGACLGVGFSSAAKFT